MLPSSTFSEMQDQRFSRRNIIAFTLIAIALFLPLFRYQGYGNFDFWWWMSSNLIFLIFLASIADPSYRKFLQADLKEGTGRKVLLGIASAAFLYLVFFAGNYVSRQLFNFADTGIQDVYDFKGSATAFRIGLLMLLVIGPGEELFWRGFLQRHYESRIGRAWGFVAATLVYTGVHVLTGNPMLIVAALFAGIFWGWMFMRYRSMVMNSVSHIFWDIAVFIVIPFH